MDHKPPRFIGSHGENWCARPAQFGPPDHVNQTQMQWLIVPGPPLSCYLAYVFPRAEVDSMAFYHMHPETWSLHVVLSGKGHYFAEGKGHDIGPGDVLFHGPGVRHALYPQAGSHLMHLAIQHPGAGHSSREWVACPEAGTTDNFGQLEAFVKRFGSPTADAIMSIMSNEQIYSNERWVEYIKKKAVK